MTPESPVNLVSQLDTHFRGQKRIALGKLVEDIRHGAIIPCGTFVVMASGDRKLRAKILDKDAPHKGFSVPLPLSKVAGDFKITPRYLLWLFARPFVGEHLLFHSTGSVFLRVPKRVLHALPIPIPKEATRLTKANEVVLTRKHDEFGDQLGSFYDDYVLNVRNERYHTAIILAGAMAEMIIYQSLIDQGVDRKLLSEDRNLGLGRMLTYLRLLKLDRASPFTHLFELQKKRNAAVHAGMLAGSKARFGKSDLVCFDHIIKHYGI